MAEQLTVPGTKSRNPSQDELSVFLRTPEFKSWFGDWEADPASASKIVDEQGMPQIVYAGQASGIQEFHGDARDRTGRDETGYYFSKDWRVARFFAQTKRDPITDEPIPASIYACILNIKTPEYLSGADARRSTRVTAIPEGYDGYVNDKLKEIVVFDPSQILIIGETPVSEFQQPILAT